MKALGGCGTHWLLETIRGTHGFAASGMGARFSHADPTDALNFSRDRHNPFSFVGNRDMKPGVLWALTEAYDKKRPSVDLFEMKYWATQESHY